MKNACKVELFKSNTNLDFLDEVIDNSTPENVAQNIKEYFEKDGNSPSFAITISGLSEEDAQDYNSSIKGLLIPQLVKKIESRSGGTLKLQIRRKLISELKGIFLQEDPESKTNESTPTTSTEQERRNNNKNKSLKRLKNIIFGKEVLLKNYQEEQFKDQIKARIIFDPSSSSIVYDQETLNKNLREYRQYLYEKVYDFCRQNHIPVIQHRQYLDPKTGVVLGESNLDEFFKYIINMSDADRETQMAEDWNNIVLKKQPTGIVPLLEAVNAYISLIKFDDLIEECVGKYISFDRNLDEPISFKDQGINGLQPVYKYNFGRRKTNMQKDFRDTMQSALDTMGNFSKFLIESIPRIDSYGHLNQVQFINALLHLKAVIQKLPTNNELYVEFQEHAANLHNDPVENWKWILDNFQQLIEKEESSRNIKKINTRTFLNLGLTHEDIIILRSIYAYVFDGKKSLYWMEHQAHKNVGEKEIYPLVNTLIGTIDSVSEMSYMQTSYNYDLGCYEVTTKQKYYADKQIMDLVYGINAEVEKKLSNHTQDKYKINYSSGTEASFEINKDFKIIIRNIKDSGNQSFGVLEANNDKLEVIAIINGKEENLTNYFNSINLYSNSGRRELLGDSLNETQKNFMQLLQFIDNVLHTELGSTNEGLQKYYIFKTAYSGGLKDLILSAAKVYIDKSIYTKFLSDIENKVINPATGEYYTEYDFQTWLQQNMSRVPFSGLTKERDLSNGKYFRKDYGIEYLKPIQYNERWVIEMGNAQSVLSGESIKATTKDFNRNNIPNYSPAFLGAAITEELSELNQRKQNRSNTTQNLMLNELKKAISQVIIDTDVKMVDGQHKAVSDMTETELQYHFFVNKFVLPYSKNKLIIQPIVYSDKKKFINYMLDLENIEDIKTNEQIIGRIKETLGSYYKGIFENVIQDYAKLFGISVEKTDSHISNKTVKEIQERLHKYTSVEKLISDVQKYNEDNPDDKIELIEDVHYRNLKNNLGLNETLYYYANELYEDGYLEKRLQDETLNYINNLLKSGTVFRVDSIESELDKIARNLDIKLSDWKDSDGLLILAKVSGVSPDGQAYVRNISYGSEIELQEGENIEYNPIIERYVLLHNLINNNVREVLAGSDIVHKIKISKEDITGGLSQDERNSLKLNDRYDLVDLSIALDEMDVDEGDYGYYRYLKDKLDNSLYRLQSRAQNAQLKRTVAIPGTMRYFLQNTLTGILPELRCAIIRDVHASTFNLDGQTKENLEAHDGGAFLNPITAIFQNNSLQDSEVGTIIKPLWQINVSEFGSKRLVKYAAHTMTNEFMRDSVGSQISFLNMFRKMTDVSWEGRYSTKEKNILNQYNHRSNGKEVEQNDIFQYGQIYYTIGNKTYEIENFGFDEGGYYTIERQVAILGKNVREIANSRVKYYHRFDNKTGEHFKIAQGGVIPENTHTVDSIWELYSVFGGMYSQSYVDGKFVYSEASIKTVANMLNMVSETTEKYEEDKQAKKFKDGIVPSTQEYYRQPLKAMMVDYLINQSAIKNGTGNINESDIYYNPENELNDITEDKPLRTISLSTSRYGIQQDSDHEADEAELTEMTQVISSIDAGGFYHEEVKELYNAIGQLALKAADIEIKKVAEYLKTNNYNILYDLVGRTLIEHLSFNRGQSGLAEAIVNRIKQKFSLNSNHELDELKIPFSDQSIYSQIISTVSSILNKKSVKRKFPGTGQVMVPGYNIVQVYDFNGETFKYDDIINLANEKVKSGEIKLDKAFYNSPTEYNKEIVKKYLTSRQERYAKDNTSHIIVPTDKTREYTRDFWDDLLFRVNPTDIIQVKVTTDSESTVLPLIKLSSINDYYDFKENPVKFIEDKYGITNIRTLDVVKRIDVPRDLAPLRLSFTYVDASGKKHTRNIYDHWSVRDMYFKLDTFRQQEYTRLLRNKKLSEDQRQELLNKAVEQERIRLREIEQNQLVLIDNNKYEDEDGNQYDIIEKESLAAETIMSNIYKSIFDLKEGESLQDILRAGPDRFILKPEKFIPKDSNFDLALLKGDGKGVFISFDNNELRSEAGFYQVKTKQFENINKHRLIEREIVETGSDGREYTRRIWVDEYTGQEEIRTLKNGKTVENTVYLLDSNNVEVLQLGVEVNVDDEVEYDTVNDVFKDINTKQEIKNRHFVIKDGKILEYIQFVDKKTVKPTNQDKYTLYNIKSDLISKLYGDDNKTNDIIYKLYNNDFYAFIAPGREIQNREKVESALKYVSKQVKDPDFTEYINGFLSAINYTAKNSSDYTLMRVSSYNTHFVNYSKVLAKNRYSSFIRSLDFISSRIPAQSLQSFMKMKVIGFCGVDTNQAFVTHWQTWLQGSDYDIDKSYMLGSEIDDNGIYSGWSKLFDYSSIETLRASEELPFARNIQLYTDSNGPSDEAIDIDDYVEEYQSIKGDRVAEINLLARLIKYINSHANDRTRIDIYWDRNSDKEFASAKGYLISRVNLHNSQTDNIEKSSNMLKNFISSKLLKIIQGTKNLIGSQSPITMDDLHDAADSVENSSSVWTVMNPGYIPLMQNQNMVGKKGVGIAANGQKASFIWKYWMTEEINNRGEFYNEVKFPEGFSIDRIEGRYGKAIRNKAISRLPDVNMYNASDEDKIIFNFTTEHYVTSDLMLSQMISAATDNAKELILERINANTDLSKVYMYLITLGFDVKDIVQFMKSEAIDLIAKNANSNIFLNGYNIRTIDLANYILNKIELAKKGVNSDLFKDEKGNDIKIAARKTPSINRYSFLIDEKVSKLLELRDDEQPESYLNRLDDIFDDVSEFIKIYKLSEEFSYAGRFLGLNQGVPTTKEELVKFKKFIKNIITSREKETNITRKEGDEFYEIAGNFDVDRWLQDPEYRRTIIRYYDTIKGSLNVFALIEATPQFKTVLDILNLVNVIDSATSVKSKAFDKFADSILDRFPFAKEDYLMQLLPSLNKIIVENFVEKTGISIPLLQNWSKMDNKGDLNVSSKNGIFQFGNQPETMRVQISNLHYLMDNYIIPMLKEGRVPKLVGKSSTFVVDKKLIKNPFISSLISAQDGNKTKYKLNIDMLAVERNSESYVKFRELIKGLEQLQGYKIGTYGDGSDFTLADLFMLYSLIVDQNMPGSDKMTKIFDTFISENKIKDNLLIRYFTSIGEDDFNKEIISKIDNMSINDILIELALPARSTQGRREPSLKIKNADGTIEYKLNIGYEKYQSLGDMLPIKSIETQKEKMSRLKRREQYGFGSYYSDYINDIITNLSTTSPADIWIETLGRVISNDYLKYYLKCV